MTNIRIDDNALERIITKNSDVKIVVECDIPKYKIKYLIKELKVFKVSEETLKTLRILDKNQ